MNQTNLLLHKAFSGLFCFFSLALSAQTTVFTPLVTNEASLKKIAAAIAARFEKDVKLLQGPQKGELAALYKERAALLSKHFTDGDVLCATAPQQYLTQLAETILNANPALPAGEVRLLFSRSFYANAASMGEGTILFNIGLFHRLQNEAQAAFVICHELAHYYLDHSNQNMAQYVATTNSAAFQKSLKQIQRSTYQQASQLEALTQNLMFKSRRHSRAFEQAADSMALELLKNTGFDVQESLTCLRLLDSADSDKFKTDLALQKQFDLKTFPFKQRWLERDDLRFNSTAIEKTSAQTDSLKTHPDCAKRIEILQPRVQLYTKAGSRKFVVSEQLFQNLIAQFDFEIVEACVQTNQTSRAFYFALQMLPYFPDNAYLHAIIGQSLNEIYTHQKAHTLSTITELPNDAFNKEYNELLQFIQNLRLPEISALAFHFLNQNAHRFATDARFANAFAESKKNFNQP